MKNIRNIKQIINQRQFYKCFKSLQIDNKLLECRKDQASFMGAAAYKTSLKEIKNQNSMNQDVKVGNTIQLRI